VTANLLTYEYTGQTSWNQPASSAEVKNGGAIPSLPIRLNGMVLN
jgi:hypothetical protein